MKMVKRNRAKKLFSQLQEHKQEIIFPFAFVNPVRKIAMERHCGNRLKRKSKLSA